MKFVFDLDGTITSQETLPLIASHFKIEAEISELTRETIQGNIPFIESFIRRVHILGDLPVDQIDKLLGEVELYSNLLKFIKDNIDNCIIATGNLDCWVKTLVKKIGCKTFTSTAIVTNNKVEKIEKILKKEDIVKHYQNMGETVIFIGDGNNDVEAMRIADISIAVGTTHHPANSVLPFTDYLIFNEKSLCLQLNQLLLVVPE
ncbi:MAG TPA: HAD-IB family phosphatase [Bacteroidales bacterium]|nr:HAD-IB family phosphatase [Bacteroidales bacterium]